MKIAVIGMGNMGQILATLLEPSHTLSVYDHQSSRLREKENVQVLANLAGLSDFTPDILLNCVTIGSTIEVFRECIPYLKPECLLVDIASLKEGLQEFYNQCGHPFVSLHPMFGPIAMKNGTLSRENVLIIEESQPAGQKFFSDLFADQGCRLHYCLMQQHDQMMSYSLSLPFLSSFAFAASLDRLSVPGSTFAKHLQVARDLLSEDDNLLCEILFNPASLTHLEQICRQLEFLKHIIAWRDKDEACSFLDHLRQHLELQPEPYPNINTMIKKATSC